MMKHLRRFNESSTELYKKIDYTEYDDKVNDDKWIEFDKNVYDKIQSMIDMEFICIDDYETSLENIIDDRSISIYTIYNDTFTMFQTDDEWFYVQYVDKGKHSTHYYYKCDGLEGLIQVLKIHEIIR